MSTTGYLSLKGVELAFKKWKESDPNLKGYDLVRYSTKMGNQNKNRFIHKCGLVLVNNNQSLVTKGCLQSIEHFRFYSLI